MRRLRTSLPLLLLAASAACASAPLIGDFGQCAARCRAEHGTDALGTRSGPLADTCRCARGDRALGEIARRNPVEVDDPGARVCGRDGVTRPDWVAALRGVRPLHAGRCGQCSNRQDLRVYRRTRHDLTDRASRCALIYLLAGRDAALRCTRAIGFSPGCAGCWVDNMGCTIVHCRALCLPSRLSHEPNTVDGRLNDCLACDEQFCGAPFIRCAGVNRRRAGILSDIDRADTEIWRR